MPAPVSSKKDEIHVYLRENSTRKWKKRSAVLEKVKGSENCILRIKHQAKYMKIWGRQNDADSIELSPSSHSAIRLPYFEDKPDVLAVLPVKDNFQDHCLYFASYDDPAKLEKLASNLYRVCDVTTHEVSVESAQSIPRGSALLHIFRDKLCLSNTKAPNLTWLQQWGLTSISQFKLVKHGIYVYGEASEGEVFLWCSNAKDVHARICHFLGENTSRTSLNGLCTGSPVAPLGIHTAEANDGYSDFSARNGGFDMRSPYKQDKEDLDHGKQAFVENGIVELENHVVSPVSLSSSSSVASLNLSSQSNDNQGVLPSFALTLSSSSVQSSSLPTSSLSSTTSTSLSSGATSGNLNSLSNGIQSVTSSFALSSSSSTATPSTSSSTTTTMLLSPPSSKSVLSSQSSTLTTASKSLSPSSSSSSITTTTTSSSTTIASTLSSTTSSLLSSPITSSPSTTSSSTSSSISSSTSPPPPTSSPQPAARCDIKDIEKSKELPIITTTLLGHNDTQSRTYPGQHMKGDFDPIVPLLHKHGIPETISNLGQRSQSLPLNVSHNEKIRTLDSRRWNSSNGRMQNGRRSNKELFEIGFPGRESRKSRRRSSDVSPSFADENCKIQSTRKGTRQERNSWSSETHNPHDSGCVGKSSDVVSRGFSFQSTPAHQMSLDKTSSPNDYSASEQVLITVEIPDSPVCKKCDEYLPRRLREKQDSLTNIDLLSIDLEDPEVSLTDPSAGVFTNKSSTRDEDGMVNLPSEMFELSLHSEMGNESCTNLSEEEALCRNKVPEVPIRREIPQQLPDLTAEASALPKPEVAELPFHSQREKELCNPQGKEILCDNEALDVPICREIPQQLSAFTAKGSALPKPEVAGLPFHSQREKEPSNPQGEDKIFDNQAPEVPIHREIPHPSHSTAEVESYLHSQREEGSCYHPGEVTLCDNEAPDVPIRRERHSFQSTTEVVPDLHPQQRKESNNLCDDQAPELPIRRETPQQLLEVPAVPKRTYLSLDAPDPTNESKLHHHAIVHDNSPSSSRRNSCEMTEKRRSSEIHHSSLLSLLDQLKVEEDSGPAEDETPRYANLELRPRCYIYMNLPDSNEAPKAPATYVNIFSGSSLKGCYENWHYHSKKAETCKQEFDCDEEQKPALPAPLLKPRAPAPRLPPRLKIPGSKEPIPGKSARKGSAPEIPQRPPKRPPKLFKSHSDRRSEAIVCDGAAARPRIQVALFASQPISGRVWFLRVAFMHQDEGDTTFKRVREIERASGHQLRKSQSLEVASDITITVKPTGDGFDLLNEASQDVDLSDIENLRNGDWFVIEFHVHQRNEATRQFTGSVTVNPRGLSPGDKGRWASRASMGINEVYQPKANDDTCTHHHLTNYRSKPNHPSTLLPDYSKRVQLCKALDITINSQNRDWRQVAGSLGFTVIEIAEIHDRAHRCCDFSPTDAILYLWEERDKSCSLERLVNVLREIGRLDVVEDLGYSITLERQRGALSSSTENMWLI